MISRLLKRTVLFALLTVLAFLLMEPLTRGSGWPEVMQCMKAAAVLAWAEISITWIRVCMSPKLDVQETASYAQADTNSGMPAAVIFLAHQFTWAVRLIVFVVIYGVL